MQVQINRPQLPISATRSAYANAPSNQPAANSFGSDTLERSTVSAPIGLNSLLQAIRSSEKQPVETSTPVVAAQVEAAPAPWLKAECTLDPNEWLTSDSSTTAPPAARSYLDLVLRASASSPGSHEIAGQNWLLS